MNLLKENYNDTLVIIPAFNEENNIEKVINDLSIYFQNIVLIDDGSIDNTNKFALSTKNCKIIKHSINCGQGCAIRTGIRYFIYYTNFSHLITFDADGQHQVKDSLKMLQYAKNNNLDALFASRFLGNKKTKLPLYRKIFLKLATVFEYLFFGLNLTDAHNGLRILSRKSCKKLIFLNSSEMAHATEIPNLLSKGGIEIIEYPCEIKYDFNKKSNTLFDSLNIISDLIQKK